MPARLVALLAALFLLGAACDDEEAAAPTPAPPSPAATSPVAESPVPEPPVATCSASGEEVDLVAQPDLPEAVAETRQEIARAAVACDFGRLASIAREGGQTFTYSFGAGGGPARFWRREERAGDEPMRFLIGVLDRPFETITAGGTVHYVWPSAFAFGDWRTVPTEDREALKPLYDEQDFEFFARFGGYVGYRVGISESGEWLYFVAGD